MANQPKGNKTKTNFRLPRKVKKKLKGNLWLYPRDEKGNSLMAWPTRYQKDYTDVKKGVVRNLMDSKNAKAKRKAYREKMDKENSVSDDELQRYVNDIFREDIRKSAYSTLIAAKKDRNAIVAYYNFVNAFQLSEAGEDSFGNVCCLALDKAEDLLKKRKRKYRKK